MPAYNYQILSKLEYFHDLVWRIDATQKGTRVAVATMAFDPHERPIHDLIIALTAAARRGVQTHLVLDAYTFLVHDKRLWPGPLWSQTKLPVTLPEPFHTTWAVLQEFEAAGGRYGITNIPVKPFRNPYSGRSHIKGAVIGDYIYIGGCNLDSPGYIDIMLGRTHKESADWVYDWFVSMCATASTVLTYQGADKRKAFGDGSEIIIDSGIPRRSAIYRRALRLIDSAKETVYLTCQFFPGGETAQHLLAAHKRGVDVRIVYSHPATHGSKRLMHALHVRRERMRLPTDFFAEQQPARTPKLHAKILVTDSISLIGSHNYVPQGVNLGTAEIALQNNNPDLAQTVIRKIGSQL
ncbi:MAG TPA: phospholipase D-like domain-containing protein [Candidatus Saccharimonadales bacterium]|nr:phospholipase D-like domain-containing protein [Candidatus Saccharimonadales bacterium]